MPHYRERISTHENDTVNTSLPACLHHKHSPSADGMHCTENK